MAGRLGAEMSIPSRMAKYELSIFKGGSIMRFAAVFVLLNSLIGLSIPSSCNVLCFYRPATPRVWSERDD